MAMNVCVGINIDIIDLEKLHNNVFVHQPFQKPPSDIMQALVENV